MPKIGSQTPVFPASYCFTILGNWALQEAKEKLSAGTLPLFSISTTGEERFSEAAQSEGKRVPDLTSTLLSMAAADSCNKITE